MSPEQRLGPINPAEITELRIEQIPDQVYEAFNGLIAQNIRRGRAVVMQKDVVALLEEKGLIRNEIFNKHWLDVEEIYQKAGWQVKYDKPVYYAGENYEPYFEFNANKADRH